MTFVSNPTVMGWMPAFPTVLLAVVVAVVLVWAIVDTILK